VYWKPSNSTNWALKFSAITDFGAEGAPAGTKHGKSHISKENIALILKTVGLNSTNWALNNGSIAEISARILPLSSRTFIISCYIELLYTLIV
jgi:hypothetical protein